MIRILVRNRTKCLVVLSPRPSLVFLLSIVLWLHTVSCLTHPFFWPDIAWSCRDLFLRQSGLNTLYISSGFLLSSANRVPPMQGSESDSSSSEKTASMRVSVYLQSQRYRKNHPSEHGVWSLEQHDSDTSNLP